MSKNVFWLGVVPGVVTAWIFLWCLLFVGTKTVPPQSEPEPEPTNIAWESLSVNSRLHDTYPNLRRIKTPEGWIVYIDSAYAGVAVVVSDVNHEWLAETPKTD